MKNNHKLENYKIAKIKSSQKIISKEAVFLVVSLIISLAVFFSLALPEYKKMKVAELEINLIKDNLKSRESTINKIENFNKKYKDIKNKDLDKASSLLSDRNNFEEHLSIIDNTAKTNGILIDNFSITESSNSISKSDDLSKEDSNTSKFKTVEISFSAKGSFSGFFLFLDSLEKSIPLVDFKELRIKKNETEEETVETEETEIVEIEVEDEIDTEDTEETKEIKEEETEPDILEYDVTLSFYYL